MGLDTDFTGRVGIIQRILASYRKPFFDKLGARPGISLSVFAGKPWPNETTRVTDYLEIADLYLTENRRRLVFWWHADLLTWLGQFDPQVLILGIDPRMLSGWTAIRWMKQRKRPVLGWGLGELALQEPSWRRFMRQMITQRLLDNVDGMIAYGSKAANDYVAAGIPAEKIFIAYNSVDNEESEGYLARLGGEQSWIKPWKETQDFDPQLPIVLFVGRLIREKRIDLLIEACAPLLNRCQLLIVGDGPERSELEQQAAPYGNRIRFGGYQSGMPLAKSFIAADVFVLPGLGGLAVHQAMSYGKAVIVSSGDGTEIDLVRKGVNGAFVRPDDVTELSQKLADLIARPELRQEMGQASLSIIRNEINVNTMVDSFCRAVAAMTEPF